MCNETNIMGVEQACTNLLWLIHSAGISIQCACTARNYGGSSELKGSGEVSKGI